MGDVIIIIMLFLIYRAVVDFNNNFVEFGNKYLKLKEEEKIAVYDVDGVFEDLLRSESNEQKDTSC